MVAGSRGSQYLYRLSSPDQPTVADNDVLPSISQKIRVIFSLTTRDFDLAMMTISLLFVLLLCLPLASLAFQSPKTRNIGNKRTAVKLFEHSSRREFLGQAVLTTGGGLAGAGLWLPPSSAIAEDEDSKSKEAIELPPMGLGAWAWGDSLFWGYDRKEDEELHKVFDYAVSHSKSPKTFFDTAELYGLGRSETLLGTFSESCPDQVQIATKFAAIPTRTKSKNVVDACLASQKRLGGNRPIDLYQIHFPNLWSNAEFWDGLADAYDRGLVKAVGVSNYGVDAIRACHKALADRGIPLATNQIQLSLLYRWPLENGLLETCRELNVQVLAYSPLALGCLTGKYSSDNMPSGPRKALFEQLLSTPDYASLLEVMKGIASNHADASLSQVAINWTRAKGTVPIPGARTVTQVKQNYGALDWDLSSEEEKLLDDAASKVTTFLTPDKSPFPPKDINTGLKMFDS